MNKQEAHVNRVLSEMQDEEGAVNNYYYLTNKSRGKTTSANNIRTQHRNERLGSLLKRLDPQAYYCLKSDYPIK